MNNEAFVYKWYDKKLNKYYIGSHKGTIDDGYICSSKYMLEEYKKRSEDFIREIIKIDSYENVVELEKVLLEKVNAAFNNQYYNKTNGTGKVFNSPMTIEKRQKISEANKGQIPWNKGKSHSEETKIKMSEARKKQGSPWMKGIIFSEETKKKIKENHYMNRKDYTKENHPFYNKTHSEETKIKMSESAKLRPLTEERLLILRNNAQKMRGISRSEETKKKISIAHKGRPLSKTHIENIRQNNKTRDKSWMQTKEYKEKMSKSCSGIKRSEETKKKMRKPKSPEHIAAILESKRLKKLQRLQGF